MPKLIDRYVYDVVRRLPEKEQGEVSRELRANIYDMLPDDATDDDIRAVLQELGSPALLAEQYRQHPRCLISPSIFDNYVRALKWVLPLVGCILLVIGLFQGGIGAAKNGVTELPKFLSRIISVGISTGVEGALHALIWTTVGFAIADRVGTKTRDIDSWSVDKLPDDVPSPKGTIPLSDSIPELVITTFFTVLGVFLCLGTIPAVLVLSVGDVQIFTLFTDSFLLACVPVIIVSGALSICECVIKIVKRHWTPLVCGIIIVNNLTCIGLLIYLCSRRDIFSSDFIALAQSQEWSWLETLRLTGSSLFESPVIILIITIVTAASLAQCTHALYKTLRARRD